MNSVRIYVLIYCLFVTPFVFAQVSRYNATGTQYEGSTNATLYGSLDGGTYTSGDYLLLTGDATSGGTITLSENNFGIQSTQTTVSVITPTVTNSRLLVSQGVTNSLKLENVTFKDFNLQLTNTDAGEFWDFSQQGSVLALRGWTGNEGTVADWDFTQTVTGNNVTFENNHANFGGVIKVSTNLDMAGIFTFKNNSATSFWGEGGAINAWGEDDDQEGGTVTLSGAESKFTFTGNTAIYGGAIFSSTDISVTGTNTFENNTAFSTTPLEDGGLFQGAGGAFYADWGKVTLTGNNTFKNNQAGYGGAIYGYQTQDAQGLNIGGTTLFEGNKALGVNLTYDDGRSGCGGAISVESGLSRISGNNTFTGNSATFYGGAIYSWSRAGESGVVISFDGKDSIGNFSGNQMNVRDGETPIGNDIYTVYTENNYDVISRVEFQDGGTYRFEGGIMTHQIDIGKDGQDGTPTVVFGKDTTNENYDDNRNIVPDSKKKMEINLDNGNAKFEGGSGTTANITLKKVSALDVGTESTFELHGNLTVEGEDSRINLEVAKALERALMNIEGDFTSDEDADILFVATGEEMALSDLFSHNHITLVTAQSGLKETQLDLSKLNAFNNFTWYAGSAPDGTSLYMYIDPQQIPEPSSILLMVFGVCSVVFLVRKRTFLHKIREI